jgi:hypothetical protein
MRLPLIHRMYSTTTNQQLRKYLLKKGNQQTIYKKSQNFYLKRKMTIIY